MKINVTKDNVCILNKESVHEGEYKINELSFEFSEEYSSDLIINAVFTNELGKAYQMSIIDNKCHIPAEILADTGQVLLGVYAYKVNGKELELRYSPFPTSFNVISGSYDPSTEESQEITSTQFEQYMQALQNGLNQVQDSISELNQATDNANDLVDEINQKLENGEFIGPQGPQGIQGKPGKDGTNGIDGVGITTITSGQATEENGNTITPITVEKTDGSSETFNVSAKNGIDGKNGQNGKDGINGTNGIDGQDGITPNIQIGTVETLEPTEQASVTRTGTDEEPLFNFGIPKGDKGDTGEITEDTLDNAIPKQNVKDSIININYALKYKTFDFKIDGAYKQTTYQGKNLANFSSLYCPILTGSLENQEATINGTTEQNTNVTLEFKKENVNLKANQPYTISVICSGTVTGGTYKKLYLSFNENDSIEIGEYSSNHTTTYTFTPDTDMQVRSINMDISLGQTFNNLKVKVQIEEGSTATDYEPYVGGVAVPNPNQPSEITTLNFDKIMSSGQNLFDVNDIAGDNVTNNNFIKTTVDDADFIHVEINNTNGSFEVFANYWTAPSKKLLPNHDYLVAVEVKEYNGNGYNNYVGTESVTQFKTGFSDWNKKTGIITGVVTTKDNFDNANSMLKTFIECKAYSTVSITYRISILADLTVNQENFVYKPYQATDYSINLQGNEMVSLPNGVKDEVQIDKEGNINLIKKLGKKVIEEDDIDSFNTDWYTLLNYVNLKKPENYIGYGTYDLNYSYNNIIMDRFYQFPDYTPRETYDKIYSFNPFQGQYMIGLMFSKNTTLDDVKPMIIGTTMYYQLKEPQTISLGKLSDIITTEQGSNTFAINGNIDTNISTTYALDLKKYIDNKIATVSTAVIGE